MADAARIGCFAVAEHDAGRHLFAHPIAGRLVEALPIAMATPPMVDEAQQMRRLGQIDGGADPFGAQRTGAVGGEAERQRAQELAPFPLHVLALNDGGGPGDLLPELGGLVFFAGLPGAWGSENM